MFNTDAESQPPPPQKMSRVFLSNGLGGQDDQLDLLQRYFKEMQAMTVETSMDPDLDLLTFAIGAHYFAVVMLEETTYNGQNSCNKADEDDIDAEGELEEDSQDVDPSHNAIFPSATAPAAGDMSVPISDAEIPKPITTQEYLALPEKDKVLRWRDAFISTINNEFDDDEDEEVEEAPFEPSFGRQTLDSSLNLTGIGFSQPLAPDKGKGREEPTTIRDYLAHQVTHSASSSDAPSPPDDFINWPDDTSSEAGGPPSTVEEDISSGKDDINPFNEVPNNFAEPYGRMEPDTSIGREYLQTDDCSEVPELPEIPEDPELKKHIMESAIKFRDQLRAIRVQEYEEKRARKATRLLTQRHGKLPKPKPTFVEPIQSSKEKPIGLAYLTTSQNFLDPLHMGECNIGVYIAPEYRNLENISDAINGVVGHAFRDRDCHRLQAIIVEHKDKIDSLTLFANAGFRQEGIRRRSFYSHIDLEYKDLTYLAMLATEWAFDQNINSRVHLRPRSLWEEVLSRHQREQEEIIKMEERKFGYGSLKRTSSMETIRERIPSALSLESGAESGGFMTDSSVSSAGRISPKRRRLEFNDETRPLNVGKRISLSSESSFDTDWEMPAVENSTGMGIGGGIQALRGGQSGPSGLGKRSSGWSSASSGSSHWDMFDD